MAENNEDDWKNLSIEEKINHKNWKARIDGYDQIEKELINLDEKNEIINYIETFKRVPLDTNLPVQEKGLEVIDKILKYSPSITKNLSKDLIQNIVQKCFNSKPKIKNLSLEIIYQIIENEDVSNSLETLKIGLSAKQPKTIATTIEAFTASLKQFGPKVISPQIFLTPSIKLLEHGDKSVRDNVKLLIIECYIFLKESIKVFIKDIKPLILKELETEFSTVANQKPVITRFLLSYKPSSDKKSKESVEEEENNSDEIEEDIPIDAFDIAEPVDIMSKIPADFHSEIVEKKWQIRKEALEKLEKVINVPKIIPNDISSILEPIKNIITTDSNVNVVAQAIKCIECLAKGLRKSFSQHAQFFNGLVIEKLKEKRGPIVEACKNCLDSFFNCIDYETLLNLCYKGFKNKVPSVKEESAKLVERHILKLKQQQFNHTLIKSICLECNKLLEDSTQTVRDSGFHTLAVLMKIVGDKKVLIFLENIDDIKKNKLQEIYSSLNNTNPPLESTRSTTSTKQEVKSKTVSFKQSSIDSNKVVDEQNKPPTKLPSPKPQTTQKVTNTFETDQSEPPELKVTDSEAIESCVEMIGQENSDFLTSSVWKERLSSFEEYLSKIKETSNINAGIVYKVICLKPGLKDSNFQVIKVKCQIISYLVSVCHPFPLRIAHESIAPLIDKISDIKAKEQIMITLSDLCEASSHNFVIFRIVSVCSQIKNLKSQIESFNYIESSIREFGLNLDLKYLIPFIKKSLDAAINPELKKSITLLFTRLYIQMGGKFRVLIDDMKPPLLQYIDGEFEKCKNEKPSKPTRVFICKTVVGVSEENDDTKEGVINNNDIFISNEQDINVEDLITRVDISNELTDDILNNLNDKNWKIRNESLENISKIINSAKHITPNIGSLIQSLYLRFNDNNKNLVVLTLNICKDLIVALGKNASSIKFSLLPGVISTLNDGKVQIRNAAMSVLSSWVEIVNLESLFDGADESIISTSLKINSSTLRSELNMWLSQVIPTKSIDPKYIKSSLSAILSTISDRNAEARKSTQVLVGIIIPIVGLEIVQKYVNTLDSSSQNSLKSTIDAAIIKKTEEKKARKGVDKSKNKSDISDKKNNEINNDPNCQDVNSSSRSLQSSSESIEPSIISFVQNSQKKRLKEYSLNKISFNSKDYVTYISTNISQYIPPTIHSDLFSMDFKKQTSAIQEFITVFENVLFLNKYKDAILECSDLLIGYCTLRIIDGNPTILTKSLDLVERLLNIMNQNDKKLLNEEIEVLIPALVSKLGDNKETIRKHCVSILNICAKLCSFHILINYLIVGFENKASKVRLESCKSVCSLINSNCIKIESLPNVSKLCMECVKLINDKDSSVRNISVEFFSLFYNEIGNKVYEYLSKVDSKSIDFLREKFKRLKRLSNVNKTFTLSPSTTIIDTSNMTQNLSSESSDDINSSQSLETSLISERTNTTFSVSSKVAEFDINEFLSSNGITIEDTSIIQSADPQIPTFDQTYTYKPPKAFQYNSVENTQSVSIFIRLGELLKESEINETALNKIIESIPLSFDIISYSDEIHELIWNNLTFLLEHLFKSFLLNLDTSKSLLINCFKIINFTVHSSSFLRYLSSDALQSLFHQLLRFYDLSHYNFTSFKFQQLSGVIKSTTCLFAELAPFHTLVHSLICITSNPQFNGDSIKMNILCYLLRILLNRITNINEFPIYCDSNILLTIFNDPAIKKLFPIKVSKCHANHIPAKSLLDLILLSFITYLNNDESKNIFESIQTNYPTLYKRLLILNYKPPISTNSATIHSTTIKLFQLISQLDNRLNACITLLHLCIEHAYDVFNTDEFKELSPEIKFFIRFSFTIIRNRRIDSVINLFEQKAPGIVSINSNESSDKLLETAQNFAHKFEHISSSMHTEKGPSCTSTSSTSNICDVPTNIADLVEQVSINQPQVVESSSEQSNSKNKNIEDLRRRFEDIKRGYVN